ncbi:zinc-dependent metalloprotease, partial [Escherichia coli]|uniref:zinc-dependent metalloprotease n=1 Tax=Escherichia coli TaxID=562 RepID=UPI001AA1ACC4
DIHTVRYAYSEFVAGVNENDELQRIVREGIDSGWRFLTDQDARPAGAAHPLANLWDNGADPVEELEHILRVREIALEKFGERNIQA